SFDLVVKREDVRPNMLDEPKAGAIGAKIRGDVHPEPGEFALPSEPAKKRVLRIGDLDHAHALRGAKTRSGRERELLPHRLDDRAMGASPMNERPVNRHAVADRDRTESALERIARMNLHRALEIEVRRGLGIDLVLEG